MLTASYQLDLDRAELVQWLKSHDPHTNHLAAQRKKQTHTGSWFLRGEQYSEWQCGAIPLLWISGSRMFPVFVLLTLTDWSAAAGSGKTVLWLVITLPFEEHC
jgi:hypothetical protein